RCARAGRSPLAAPRLKRAASRYHGVPSSGASGSTQHRWRRAHAPVLPLRPGPAVRFDTTERNNAMKRERVPNTGPAAGTPVAQARGTGTLLLSRSDVEQLLTPDECIAAVEDA